ncbi:MAG TPA: hypothetical protein VKE69_01075 [Planctomycetota bacterium]|nr:hypothetical protein [Planctomycetota bacterium]
MNASRSLATFGFLVAGIASARLVYLHTPPAAVSAPLALEAVAGSQNESFREIAIRLATAAGETVGSDAWTTYGQLPEPWTTGYHTAEGWNFSDLFAGTESERRRAHLLTLSNYAARPDKWPTVLERFAGGPNGAGMPPEWTWDPSMTTLTPSGGQLFGVLAVFANDLEHFLIEQLRYLAGLDPKDGFDVEIAPGVVVNSVLFARVECWYAARSGLGTIREGTWGATHALSDRIAARLFRAIESVQQLPTYGYLDETDRADLVNWGVTIALAALEGTKPGAPAGAGVSTFDKYLELVPPVGVNPITKENFGIFYLPVQSWGYREPVWFWAAQDPRLPGWLRVGFAQALPWMSARLVADVEADGKTPWAVRLDGTKCYDPKILYGYGPSVYTALRIAELLKVAGAKERADAILARFASDASAKRWLVEPSGAFASTLAPAKN